MILKLISCMACKKYDQIVREVSFSSIAKGESVQKILSRVPGLQSEYYQDDGCLMNLVVSKSGRPKAVVAYRPCGDDSYCIIGIAVDKKYEHNGLMRELINDLPCGKD